VRALNCTSEAGPVTDVLVYETSDPDFADKAVERLGALGHGCPGGTQLHR
jgi:hypothetical protein